MEKSAQAESLPPTRTAWGLATGVALPAALLVLGVATKEFGWLNPAVVAGWLCLTPVAIHVGFRFRKDLAAALAIASPLQRRSVIVGANSLGRQFRHTLASLPRTSFHGFFDDRATDRLGLGREEPLLGRIDHVKQRLKEERIDVVYIALPMNSHSRTSELLAKLKDTTASVYFVPDTSLVWPMKPHVEIIASTPVVRVCETPFLGVNGMVKRAEDLILGTLLLLVCLPFLLLIAAAVKLDSPGPIIFRQRRHGLEAREIVVYKFRTMKVLEDGPDLRQARLRDPRITRVGTMLRRYSLDELPQLINVLQGRMSLVGPRPHAVAHTEIYRKLISGYMIRHKVRPGITGWAQVNGLRGETDSLEKMKTRVEYDLAYLSDWSLALDLAILARTAWTVMRARNAH